MATTTLRDELEALERQGWDSLCNSSGDKFYGRTMTDDGLMVLANGQVMTRDDVVSALGDAPAWGSYELDDVRVVDVSGDVAGLVYRGTARRGDTEIVCAMTSIYVRAGDDWKLAVYTQAPIASST